MATNQGMRRLERRVETLERELSALRHPDEERLKRAKALLVEHLRTHQDVEPLAFAVSTGLPPDIVEAALKEFDRKKWTVPVDD